MSLISAISGTIRKIMRNIAKFLNTISRGHLHPNTVTIFGFLMHLPIALIIATGHHFILAAILLIIFGLFDTLDGELARLQQRPSTAGMLLDATTDRLKEVILYSGIAFYLARASHPTYVVYAVIAVGASISVSYVKAKGEAALMLKHLETPLTHHQLNRYFSNGLLTFELRMFLLVVGLLTNQIIAATIIIAVLSSITVIQRLVIISIKLNNI